MFSSGDVLLTRVLPQRSPFGLPVHVVASQLAPFSARVGVPKSQTPDGINPPGIWFWRRPIDSLTPVRSPATLAGLTVYPLASQHDVFSARVGDARNKKPSMFSHTGFLVLATSYSRTAYRRTTIGAAAFHCRVRNGNGWGHCASVTRSLRRACRHKFLVRDS